jgi:hypothetical protein
MNLVRSLRPLRYGLEKVLYRHTKNSKMLMRLRDLAKGMPVLVIGNGPSLKQTPLDEFKHVPSIGMNKINLIFPHLDWRPSLVVCMNRHVMEQNQDFYTNTDIPVFQCWQNRWFIKTKNRSKGKYFLNLNSGKFSNDISVGIGISGTVTYTALQFAYYMGANPVILFGVDHFFSSKGPANQLVVSDYDDLDHFDKNYFGKGVKWNLPDLFDSERAYKKAKYAFEIDGRVIYDATVNGKLSVFPKINLKKALKICSASKV